MRKVTSGEKLKNINIIGNKIFLRKNIIQKSSEDSNYYEADEVSFESTNIDISKIKNNFDLYFNWGKEKMNNEKLQEEKENLVKKMVEKDYTLADLKETVDQLLIGSLTP